MKLPVDSSESDGPNLTPVIDVVFLLLIFFLVATEYHDAERELDVTLPEVAQAQPLAMTPELIVNITNEGRYKVAAQEYGEPELAALIAQAKKNNPQQSTLIRGDGDSALRYAVRVMGLCNKVKMPYRIAALQE
ncbi:MAG: biopolymer transporter ExbD [Planctomycetota bacterium]|nr:biopolymer transporter ExbD [Planctomycetota bacterium]MDA1251984.1 biopolymer transporter ExbD [Planctomycetota bacterium]